MSAGKRVFIYGTLIQSVLTTYHAPEICELREARGF